MKDDYVAREALADPVDWLDHKTKHVHNWQPYVSNEVRAIWMTFTPEQKVVLAYCFQEMADREEWD